MIAAWRRAASTLATAASSARRGEPVRSSRATSRGTEEEGARDDPEHEEDAEDRPVDGRVEGRAAPSCQRIERARPRETLDEKAR